MDMSRVASTAIFAVGYDENSMRMRVTFIQGHSYDFCRVPRHIYNGLISAASKGGYYNDHIKDRYQC